MRNSVELVIVPTLVSEDIGNLNKLPVDIGVSRHRTEDKLERRMLRRSSHFGFLMHSL